MLILLFKNKGGVSMCRKVVILLALAIMLTGSALVYPQGLWVGKDGNIRNVETRAMVIDGSELYLATRSEVYRAKDVEERWESIFSVSAGENEVTCLGGSAKNILVGTKRGLFRSEDCGHTWKNIFRTIIPEKNNVTSLEVSKYNPKTIAIATRKGVFMSEDSGNRWRDISGNINNKSPRCIALDKDSIYAGGEGGLYVKGRNSSGWERIYIRSALEKTNEEEMPDPVEAEAETEPETENSINCIVIKDSILYIGLDKGIFYSEDSGKNWRPFYREGLSGIINHILLARTSDRIYCATTNGIYEFDKEKTRWLELYRGMDRSAGANSLALSDENEKFLWALTEKGLYRLEPGRYMDSQYIDVERSLKALKIVFDGEPTYAELATAAMKFAEVDPDKIKKWRSQARLRAIMPKVSVGVNNDRSTKSEIYTSATREYVTIGPDDISKGLDVSVSWDLANLIWADDQTNIDVRSRLTTELRNDILDGLRRIYYERRRIQFEMVQAPPKDLNLRFEKELRIQELTQAIDDLTGNYLSEDIAAKANDKLPDGGK